MSVHGPVTRTVDERYNDGLVACLACRFWDGNHPDPAAPGLAEKDGQCHRHAPAVGGWPHTRGEQWCGEFRPLTPLGTAPGPADANLVNLDGRILTIPPGYRMFIQGGRAAITPIPAADADVAPPDPPPIAKDPGRGARSRLNAVPGEVPTE